MIRRKTDGYYVLSEAGRRLGGPYRTHTQARERLQQVEYFRRQTELHRRMNDVVG